MILEKVVSKYNGEIVVEKNLGLGVCISVNGLTQSGGILNSIWKTTLKRINHQPLIVNYCLILGLGGGTVARWIGEYWPEAKIIGVDIDPVMVDLGKKYLGLDTGKIEIVIGDAGEFVNYQPLTINHQFDLIIVDLYLGDECPKKFESAVFLSRLKSHLAKGGVVVFNRLYWGEKRQAAYQFGEKLEGYFSKVDYFYPQANLMLICYQAT